MTKTVHKTLPVGGLVGSGGLGGGEGQGWWGSGVVGGGGV